MGVEQIILEIITNLGLPGVVIWWLVKDRAALVKRLETAQSDIVELLKCHQAETRAVVTEVHEMVTALRKSSGKSLPPNPDTQK